jgi:hypothetical protein
MPSRLPTGGPLNFLNERAKTNSRARSVPVTDLVRRHAPQTSSQLRQLIETHYRTTCECGIRSQGPVERFALNLYEAQFTDPVYVAQHDAVPYGRCFEFMYALFCVAPLRGVNMEVTSRHALLAALRQCRELDDSWGTREATQHEDVGCAVDYVLLHRDCPVAGVQVKPDSVFARSDVMALNRRKQREFAHPVFFHSYSTDTLSFCDRATRQLADTIVITLSEPETAVDREPTTSPTKRPRLEPGPTFW